MKNNATQKEWLVNTIGKIVQYEVSKTAKNLDNLETIVEYEVRKALKTVLKELKSQIKQELIAEMRGTRMAPAQQPQQSIKRSNPQKRTFNSSNGVLNELLNSTKPLSAEELTGGNNGASVLDLVQNPKVKQHPLSEVLTRDYTELVQAMDKTTPQQNAVKSKPVKQNPNSVAERTQLRNNILNTIELQPFDEDNSWLKDVE
jgi:hypothetical protein